MPKIVRRRKRGGKKREEESRSTEERKQTVYGPVMTVVQLRRTIVGNSSN